MVGADPPSTGGPHLGPLRLPRWRSFRIRVLFVVTLTAFTPVLALLLAGYRDELWFTLKLTLVCLPVAVLLAWWLGWRTQRALNLMRHQAWNRVPNPSFQALDVGRQDEVGDLALAINSLLRALDERHRANEAFVADLAHEFKNPVAAVRAAAESLETRAGDDARTQRLARVLTDASTRLDALVTQLLELARAEAGMPNEQRVVVDLSALVDGVTEALTAHPEHTATRVERQVAPGVTVVGVSGRLESVVRNLVDNALSFAAGQVRVSLAARGADVVLTVEDNGPGISAEDLPRVFERFFTTRGTRRGTGLGLALSRAVVEAHGGRVAVASTPGQGAVFTVVLPAA